jgi:putative transposase
VVVSKMELYELLRKADGADVDFLREGVRTLAQALMEVEVTAQVGAERGERAPERRVTHRNGYRPREWDTRVGTVELQVPKLRAGSFFPSILEPRRRAERALASVVMACYVEGVSTRRVDEVARAMGIEGISKSQVSRICGELDELVAAWRNRPLDTGPYPLVWMDALSMRVREGGRICSTAVLVATACNADGQREILGLDIGAAEDGAAWTSFLRGLVARGLSGVKLVTSDAHQGLKEAISAVLDGAAWQRCRTHWACADSSWWLAGGRCGVVGGDEGEHLCLAAKPHGRGWEVEAVFLQQGKHVVDRVADGATAHVKQVGQCPLGADLAQVQDGAQDPFRVGDLLLKDAPSGARQPVPAPALVAAPLDQGGLPDRQALHQQIQVGARHAGQGWIG